MHDQGPRKDHRVHNARRPQPKTQESSSPVCPSVPSVVSVARVI